VADDQEVINYQIALGEANELTRKDIFCGWYHSHPFDLDGTNHCYLSKTDVTTQTLWQNQEGMYQILGDITYSTDPVWQGSF
jgi:COP9 signalosome complex subunit 5